MTSPSFSGEAVRSNCEAVAGRERGSVMAFIAAFPGYLRRNKKDEELQNVITMEVAMKASLFLVLLLFLVAVPPVHAQWHVGGLLGHTPAKTAVSPEPETITYSGRLRMGIGGVVDYALTKEIDLHGMLMLIGKGTTIDREDMSDDVIWTVSSIEIPLLVRYTLQTPGDVRPFVAAGPTVGFLRAAEFDVGGEREDDDAAKSFDAGMVVGAGVLMPWQSGRLFAELRYARGMIDVRDTDQAVKNRGVLVLLGITFPLGKDPSF